jgi:hypothetical protein
MTESVIQKNHLIFLCAYLIFGYKKHIIEGSGSFTIWGLYASLGPVSRRIGYKKTTRKMTGEATSLSKCRNYPKPIPENYIGLFWLPSIG